MEKRALVNFKVGQLAEMRTFEDGFRSAWFRCKIKDIRLKKKEMFLEYPDFDSEAPGWVKIYQLPPYAKKSKHIKKELMVRPPYPAQYHKSEMPPLNSISQPCINIDGPWKVEDLVDWFADGCYWFARIVKVLNDDKFQIDLPMPPSGQGGTYKACSKDLRPFLDWSETEGWSFPTVEGQTSCDAHLIFPTKQGMDLEDEHATAAGSPVNASSTTRTSANGDRDIDSEQNVKMDGDVMESSQSSSSLHVKKRKAADEEVEVEKSELNIMHEHTLEKSELNIVDEHTLEKSELNIVDEHTLEKSELNIMHEHTLGKSELNIMHERTLEAAVLDLEELINKVNWMQRILQSPSSDATTSSWKFA